MTGIGFPARLRVSHQNRRLNQNYRRNGKLQACEPCRKGKIRCDHQIPCSRCARRQLQCIYHPAPLTKQSPPTPEATDSSPSTSIIASQEPSYDQTSTLRFPPFESNPVGNHRPPRASSLPAQPSLHPGPLCMEDFRRPFPDNAATGDSIRFQQTEAFISHSAILAENESSIGIQPLPLDVPLSSNKIPQSHIDKGAAILALLKDLPTYDKYIEKLFGFMGGVIVIESMVTVWSTQLWSTWRKIIEAQKTEGLRKMSEKLWENTTKPLSRLLNRNTRPVDFVASITGEGLRWEVVGIIMTLVGFLGESLTDGDPIFCSHNDPPVDRAALVLKVFTAADVCVGFCKDFDIMNDVFLWLLHEYTILSCFLHARGSYSNYQCSGYLYQALVAFGLHQEIKVDDNTPFFITELRKRLFVCAYENDKYSSSFAGRPPRLTRYYCLIQIPLDLTDAQLMSDGLDLDRALANLDGEGWNQRGIIQRCTFTRIFATNALITEEILEISLGALSSEEIVRRAASIEIRVTQLLENVPEFLRLADRHTLDIKRAPIEILFLAYISLADLSHHFLLQRTLIKKVGADSSKLLAVSREMFDYILLLINHRDHFREFQMDVIQLLCMNGIPSAAVIAVELLHQEQNPSFASTIVTPLPRSETIQNLSVMVACLASIRPETGGSHITERGRRFLKKILDTILEPAGDRMTGRSSSIGDLVDPTLTTPLFQTGTDGEFVRWLESMEWDQDNFVPFS
ncbi:hypothetical protein B0J11DRAFT_254779 [Dendryphion nanum]|uniref:Zn(2)-C6 fungal-type domain-containing protein n=1 Tax=Dendryphion nanum TaxID=256645 RepID=A0A9P9ITP0_9PLEO|nr:hypothetical protein B0J11DRAFT_254779 [Dendryphion nanum]